MKELWNETMVKTEQESGSQYRQVDVQIFGLRSCDVCYSVSLLKPQDQTGIERNSKKEFPGIKPDFLAGTVNRCKQ